MNEKIRQISQVKSSDTYNDTLTVGSALQTGSDNLEVDLNAIRSQIKRIGNMSNWYDQPIPDPDEKLKVSINDTTPGFLFEKIIAGQNISIIENNDGGNETITITSTAAKITISPEPPLDPEEKDLWWDSEGGNLYIRFDDGDSQQWVIAIQVTDGKNLIPFEESSTYSTGPKEFNLSDTPYNNYVAVYVNGVRLDKTDWTIDGLVLTIIGDLEEGDEVTFDFFIADGACDCPVSLDLFYGEFNTDEVFRDEYYISMHSPFTSFVNITLGWTDLNNYSDVVEVI